MAQKVPLDDVSHVPTLKDVLKQIYFKFREGVLVFVSMVRPDNDRVVFHEHRVLQVCPYKEQVLNRAPFQEQVLIPDGHLHTLVVDAVLAGEDDVEEFLCYRLLPLDSHLQSVLAGHVSAAIIYINLAACA